VKIRAFDQATCTVVVDVVDGLWDGLWDGRMGLEGLSRGLSSTGEVKILTLYLRILGYSKMERVKRGKAAAEMSIHVDR